jgi:non-homologous end joining protein Ku
VTAAGPEAQRAQVIDLMDALKESLARPAPGKKPPAKVERPGAAPAKVERIEKKAQAGRK